MKGDPIINLFPGLIFKLIRSPNLNSNQLAFRVHKSMNKFEIKGSAFLSYALPLLAIHPLSWLIWLFSFSFF